MAGLGSPLAFPLGGTGLSAGRPWIVNLIPEPGDENVSLLRPVQFTVRDAETYVEPGALLVEVGYAKVHSEAEELFDSLPRTTRITLQPAVPAGDPVLEVVPGGVRIGKSSGGAQRSVYTTAIDAGTGFRSAMVSALITPLVVSPSTELSIAGPLNPSVYPNPGLPLPFSPLTGESSGGTVLGLEHGPRNKAVYLWLQTSDAGVRIARFTGYLRDDDVPPTPNLVIEYDWSAQHRYTITWNEAQGYAEAYADIAGVTTRLFRVPIASVPDMPEDYYGRAGGDLDVVGLYGQEGASGDQSLWSNIAVTTDVGFPILGNIRPGTFNTISRSADLFRTSGSVDPRSLDVGAWFTAPESLFPDQDAAAVTATAAGLFKITKNTPGDTFAVYRTEPGLLRSNTEGLMVQASATAANELHDEASTGSGIVVYDGQTVFQLVLFNYFSVRTVGLLKKNGNPDNINEYFRPELPLDWTAEDFRLCLDTRGGRVQLYVVSDLSTPVLDIPFDRADLPSGADFGWDGLASFVAFGHITPGNTRGTFSLKNLTLSHMYQTWEGESGVAPTDSLTDPQYTATTFGSPSTSMVDGVFTIESSPGELCKIHREAPFAINRGGTVEARVRISDYHPRFRTGTYLLLDDGLRSYALTFVDTVIGKFAALSLGAGSGFAEIVGRDGRAASLSFPVDWSQFHTYRMERRAYEGIHVFLDDEVTARIVYPEKDINVLPQEQFSGTPSLAFGQFSTEGSTSEWTFVRGFFSGGYEISFKKNQPDSVLREQLFATQAIVVAYALDV